MSVALDDHGEIVPGRGRTYMDVVVASTLPASTPDARNALVSAAPSSSPYLSKMSSTARSGDFAELRSAADSVERGLTR